MNDGVSSLFTIAPGPLDCNEDESLLEGGGTGLEPD